MNSAMATNQANLPPKPSFFSFQWWRIYLSQNPVDNNPRACEKKFCCCSCDFCDACCHPTPAYYYTPGGFYNSQGIYIIPHPVIGGGGVGGGFGHGGGGNGKCCDCGGCGGGSGGAGGSDNGIFAIILIVVAALIAFTIALLAVLWFPPMVIIGWIILVGGSIAEMITGSAPECAVMRYYNLLSSIAVALLTFYVLGQFFRLRAAYRDYYPGTPDVQVDVKGLKRVVKFDRVVYMFSIFPAIAAAAVGMAIAGSCSSWFVTNVTTVSVVSCTQYTLCPWTISTVWAWSAIHLLNAVASGMMYRRMVHKLKILDSPPTYEVERNVNPFPQKVYAQPGSAIATSPIHASSTEKMITFPAETK